MKKHFKNGKSKKVITEINEGTRNQSCHGKNRTKWRVIEIENTVLDKELIPIIIKEKQSFIIIW